MNLYFDTVGGPVADAVSENLAKRADILLVGRVAANNSAAPEAGHGEPAPRLVAGGDDHAFNRYAYKELYPLVIERLGALLRAGRLTMHNEVVDGMEETPAALHDLLSGNHVGKMLVRYSDSGGRRLEDLSVRRFAPTRPDLGITADYSAIAASSPMAGCYLQCGNKRGTIHCPSGRSMLFSLPRCYGCAAWSASVLAGSAGAVEGHLSIRGCAATQDEEVVMAGKISPSSRVGPKGRIEGRHTVPIPFKTDTLLDAC